MKRNGLLGWRSVMLAISLLLFSSTVHAQHEYGKKSDQIATFNGTTVWTGWNGSFSETYFPESETYNWILFWSPDGIFAGLTSAESVYSSVDMYAAINMFYGTATLGDDTITWDQASGFYGITFSESLDILPMVLSLDAGITFFRDSPTTHIPLLAVQFNIGSSFTAELIEIPFLPSVAIDTKGNIGDETGDGKDTGFWPVHLWTVDPNAADPGAEIAQGLRELQSSGDTSYTGIHKAQMAESLLPAFVAMSTSSGTPLNGSLREVTMGDYMGHFLAADHAQTPPEHTIDAAIDDVADWLESGDTDAPRKILNDVPVSATAINGALRMLKTGVGSGFEAAYRYGYNQAVEAGTRTDDTVYGECLVTTHCLMGDGCNIEVSAEEATALVAGTTAADFEGAEVHFDAAPSDFIQDGNTGQLISDTFADGVASYGFIRNEETSIVLGVQVPSATSPASAGKNLELCARKVVMFSLLELENVTVVDGTLVSLDQFSPDTLPTSDAPINFTHGFYTFEVTPDEPGGTVDLVLELPTSLGPGYSWAKYSLPNSEWIDWGAAGQKKVMKPDGMKVSKDRFTVTLTITDNGAYDDDDTLGIISESSGAALFDIAFAAVSADEYLTEDDGMIGDDTDSSLDTAPDTANDTANDTSNDTAFDTASDTSLITDTGTDSVGDTAAVVSPTDTDSGTTIGDTSSGTDSNSQLGDTSSGSDSETTVAGTDNTAESCTCIAVGSPSFDSGSLWNLASALFNF